MLSRTLRPVSKVNYVRGRPSLIVAPTIRTQKQVIVPPVKAQPIVVDLIIGSIALYLIFDVASVVSKDKQEQNKKDKQKK